MKAAQKEWLKGVFVAIVSVAVMLGILEIGVRIFAPQPLVATDLFLQTGQTPGATPSGATPDMQSRTARRGLSPDVVCRQTSSEFNVAVRINSKGLRDAQRPYRKPRGVTRILLLGDSFTFGYGVEERERFANVVQQKLNAGARRYEVINAGVPSWGTADQLLFLREEGLKYQPDIVAVCFYENDVHDNLERDLFVVRNGELVATTRQKQQTAPRAGTITRDPFNDKILDISREQSAPATQSAPRTSRLIAHSHLARMVRLALFSRKAAEIPASVERRKTAQILTAKLFDEINRECAKAGATFKLILIPDKSYFARSKKSTLWKFPILEKWKSQQPHRVLDLLPPLAKTAPPQSLYFPKDAHLNTRGNVVAAAAMEDFLAKP